MKKTVVTDDMRSQVRGWAQMGMKKTDIAILTGLSINTLNLYFSEELRIGPAEGNAILASAFMKKVAAGDQKALHLAYQILIANPQLHADERNLREAKAPIVQIFRTMDNTETYYHHSQFLLSVPGAPEGTPPIYVFGDDFRVYSRSNYPKLQKIAPEWLLGRAPEFFLPSPNEHKAGRKPYVASREDKEKVLKLTENFVRQEDIARLLNITAKTLRKHFREQLDMGLARLRYIVFRELHKLAKSGNLASLMLLAKSGRTWERNDSDLETLGDAEASPKPQQAPKFLLPSSNRDSKLIPPENGLIYFRGPNTWNDRIRCVSAYRLPLTWIPDQYLTPELIELKGKFDVDVSKSMEAISKPPR